MDTLYSNLTITREELVTLLHTSQLDKIVNYVNIVGTNRDDILGFYSSKQMIAATTLLLNYIEHNPAVINSFLDGLQNNGYEKVVVSAYCVNNFKQLYMQLYDANTIYHEITSLESVIAACKWIWNRNEKRVDFIQLLRNKNMLWLINKI